MLLGDAAGNRETEAVAGLAGVKSDEAFEDALALLFGHAGTVVGDARLDEAVEPLEVDVDSAGGLDRGESVVDEVAEDAFERVGVAADDGVAVGVERDRRARCERARVFDEGAGNRGEVYRCSGGVCFESGESEEVADEAAESFALSGDGCFEAVALGPFGLLAEKCLNARLEGGDGGAELVGGVGEEAAGCSLAGARILDRFLEGVEHLVEGCGEAAELGVGAAGLEAELGVAVGNPGCRLDDGREGMEGGPGAVDDEDRGERERRRCDQ